MPAIAHENKILGNINTLDDLTDVDLTSPQNGQVPIYNSTTQKWENGNQSGGATELSELDDVTVTSPTSGQVLTIRNGEWVNEDPQAGDSIIYLTKAQYDALTPAQDQMYGITDWTPEALALISDGEVVANKTWSSSKLNGQLNGKVGWSEASKSVKKNLLKNSLKSGTLNGYTKTVNSDGTVTINGSPVDSSVITVFDLVNTELSESWTIEAGTYEMSCEGLVLNDSYMAITYVTKDNQTVYDFVRIPERTGTFTITAELLANIKNWYIGLVIMAGKTISNVTYKPMIRLASIADATYEPYIPDNTELMRYTDNAVLGAKNRLPNEAISQTVNGVTFTKNADGTITANGTATADIFYVIHYDSSYSDVILSGCPANGSLNTYRIQYSNFVDQSFSDDGNGVYIPTTKNAGNWRVVIFIGNGQTVNNLVFKPMIRLATDTDDTYVPYAMTNRELTYPKTASATINTTNANSGNITIIRLGSLRIATGYFNPKVAGTSATNVTIATVPIQDIGDAFALCGRNQGDSVDTLIGGLVRINTAGELKYQGHVTGANLFFNLVYTAR